MFCLNFGAIRAAGRMAQGVCCCLCLMVCGGPILLIVGVVILATPNTRADDVKDYNTAGALFNPAPVDYWAGDINSYNTVKKSQVVTVDSGSDEGVDDFTSVFVESSVYTYNKPLVTYNIATFQAGGSLSPNYVTQKTGYATCRRSGGCTSSYYANSLCQDKYGSSASYVTTCQEDKSCKCTYDSYLNKYCLVAAPSLSNSSSFVMSTTYQSCYYPFKTTDDQLYTTTSPGSYTPFQLRLNTDPFIAMQKITKGDMDFGLTAAQQRAIALACIAIGCIMIACIALVSFILFKVIKSFTDKKGDASQPMNGINNYSNPQSPHQNNYPAQQQYPPQQQPGYGQPQPAYGQPAPGYGQPQPAYGQPQPAYGQPQPAYGQGPV